MKLYQVVAKDILRRRRRVFYTALGVVIGVAVFVAVLTVARAGEQKIYGELDKYGPNLMVMPAISDVDLQLGDLSLGTLAVGDNYIAEERLPQIRQITDGAIREALGIEDEGDIATIAPKLYVNAKIKDTSVMVVGFDPKQERQLKSWWTVSNGRYPEQQDEAMLGARASGALGLNAGDSILLKDREITVVGVLGETGSNDDYQVFVPLETVQQAFGKDGLISSMDIRALCNACPVEYIADAINKTIPGIRAVAVKQIAQTEMNLMEKVNDFLLALAGITIVVGSFGVVNTMMSSVHERVRDIGIMKSVGASRNQIVKMFLYEALVVGLVGGVIGYILGTLLSYVIGPLIFDGLAVRYAPLYLPAALGLAVFVAAVASVYPAIRASGIKVADSLRAL
ncbi:MAG TPA: FtsX-like permease family protein [Dehalococcoidia bacterium]|nr:FtsX-like permease family protein [Dehalococcoidia bacterium]